MIKQKVGKSNIIHFNGITEVVRFIRDEEELTDTFRPLRKSVYGKESFTGTKSYKVAEDLLLHGWDEVSKEFTKSLKEVNINKSYKNRTCYGVAGYQCSVPRYLQGIPTNMISNKRIPVKNKVINITKSISYSCSVKTETIKVESLKVLRLVNKLEADGYRVNLNIAFIGAKNSLVNNPKMVSVIVKIKGASQRMNIKQMAFPMVHPSMLRRIMFGVIERLPECEFLGTFYGQPAKYKDAKTLFKDTYLMPAIIEENEITDIEKYKC
jgi:hypothetical protein